MINLSSHLLQQARFSPSPNQDDRPRTEQISVLVVHGISLPPSEFGGDGIEQLFLNQLDPAEHPYYKSIAGLKVSSHLLIRRDGSMIQFVPFHRRAWHAGISMFEGRTSVNDFSIGIELEGSDDIAYTNEQYQNLAAVSLLLMNSYPSLTSERIVGHSDIAPGRKTDPGDAFAWDYFRQLLTKDVTL